MTSPLSLIDEALTQTSTQNWFSSNEVSNLLLDLRQALTRPADEAPFDQDAAT